MSSSDTFLVREGRTYGRLQTGFRIDLDKKGYYSIAGLNNSGKSTVLQLLLTQLEVNDAIYIPAERGTVRPTLDSGILPLNQYVDAFRTQVSGAASIFSDDYLDHQKPEWFTVAGPEEFKQIVELARTSMPHLTVSISGTLIAEGDMVAGRLL